MSELHKPGEDNQKPGKYTETGPQGGKILIYIEETP